ncbi:MAG: hypothetical protein PHI24_11610 [Desulfitobacteriaceae bacterium]|nr:hypothetical protein [Desulfitobacteriaceae bacterium]
MEYPKKLMDSEQNFRRARKAEEAMLSALRGGLTQSGGNCAGRRRKGFLEVASYLLNQI